ncbi:hypothetical protein ILUMI_08311 [Ignelater luminosus]|uniref:Annexin n=1 Tax=Ignelater luminosus TaxID=2038154 RepID=A0A8K0D1V3_IGNLU|nr:hypothetical protein ILUMI_08311 [Ignelater luminosus]
MKVQIALVLCVTLLQKIHGATVAQSTINDVKTQAGKISTGSFNPEIDAENLKHALDASVPDGKAIIETLTSRSSAQRLEVATAYQNLYKKDLKEEFKSKLSADFGSLLVAIITSSPEYYAKELHRAMAGTGTDNECLMEILTTLSNQELEKVRKVYQELYGVTLESAIKDDTSSHFSELLTTLCNGVRDETNVVNRVEAVADAQKLYQAGEKKWGTDESTFISILTKRNPQQLKLIAQEYKSMTGHDLGYTIECEFSGLIKKGLLTVVNVVVDNLYDYLAGRIKESIGGKSKNELTRIVATRSGTDMEPIQSSYSSNYGTDLKQAINDNTSGDYKTCLLALLGQK